MSQTLGGFTVGCLVSWFDRGRREFGIVTKATTKKYTVRREDGVEVEFARSRRGCPWLDAITEEQMAVVRWRRAIPKTTIIEAECLPYSDFDTGVAFCPQWRRTSLSLTTELLNDLQADLDALKNWYAAKPQRGNDE